jgi:hypothetical protein
MGTTRKQRWQIALFAMEIVLLMTWAFFTGMIYNRSSREFLGANFLLAVSGVARLVWQRSRAR